MTLISCFFHTVFKILLVVAIATTTFAQLQRNPNPCLGQATRWVQDYGGCENYFYCQSETIARPLVCPEGTGFDEGTQTCTATHIVLPPCLECPATEDGFAVANDATTCTDYVLCVNGVRDANVITCATGTRFDRAWGQCRLEADVECAPTQTPTPEAGPDCSTETPPIDIPHADKCDHFWVSFHKFKIFHCFHRKFYESIYLNHLITFIWIFQK